MSSFWLYGIEYEYRFTTGVIKEFQKDTGQCLHSLFYKVITSVGAYGVGSVFDIFDVKLAASCLYHLHKTENKNCSIDVFYDACIRSGFDIRDEDKDSRICCYAYIIWQLALNYCDEWKSERDELIAKMYGSTSTLSEK